MLLKWVTMKGKKYNKFLTNRVTLDVVTLDVVILDVVTLDVVTTLYQYHSI
jgi:hypothetical protein